MFEMLAREYKFSVSIDLGTTWVEIGGVNTWKWTEELNEVNVTDFDDAGWESDLPATGKAMLTLEGNHLRNPTTGARDAGQIMVEGRSRLRGARSLLQFRVETRDVTAATPPVPLGSITGTAFAKLTEKGGGVQGKMPWGAEFSVSGKPTFLGEFAGS